MSLALEGFMRTATLAVFSRILARTWCLLQLLPIIMPSPVNNMDIPHTTTAAGRAWFEAFKRRSGQRWALRRLKRGQQNARTRVNSWAKNNNRYAEDAPVVRSEA